MQNDNPSSNHSTLLDFSEEYPSEGIPQIVRPTNEPAISSPGEHPERLVAYRLDWLLIMFVAFVVIIVAISGLKTKR